ncbi:MAG: adenylate/guanylate cyclase domain-containing protein [Bdellovibrionaceae bacterium]|nr:adenylate/guanylate cyclase domain-containing protein [Bdellovibrio sp.]
MNSKWFSFILGIIITLTLSSFSFFYLRHFDGAKEKSQAIYNFFETLDLRFNDFKYKFKSVAPVKIQQVILVGVDDDSLEEVGRWPWSRVHIAEISERLISYGARSISYDIIFSEPERENKEADQIFANFVDKNQSKIILGSYSENLIHPLPYQDYCVTEAFLANGGTNLVKINPSFIVEAGADQYEELNWRPFFAQFFNAVKKTTFDKYLLENKVKSIEELTDFQRNYLKSISIKNTFDYCHRWLTAEDQYFNLKSEITLNLFKELFAKLKPPNETEVLALINKFKMDSSEEPIPQYGKWSTNIDLIQSKSMYGAAFNTKLDSDGLIRRYPLFYRAGNRLGSSFIPSLALQQYLVSTGYRAEVKIDQVNGVKKITSFIIKDPSHEPEEIVQVLPVDSIGNLMINYYGPRMTLASVSAKELLSKDPQIHVMERVPNDSSDVVIKTDTVLKSDYFKAKSVLFGITAMAVYDLRNTPIDPNYPGPEIHQTVLNNLFNKDYYRRLPHEKMILPLFLLLYGIIFSYVVYRLGAVNSAAILVGSTVMGFVIDYFLFLNKKIIISSIFFFILTFFIFMAMLIYKYLSEERKKTEIRKIFSKYVAPAVVDELLEDNKNLELGGRKENLTAYFSDIRGFTSFSEKMDPQTLTQVLNEYLTPMTEIVFRNKGTLDKYMGDAIMAFFGAPLNYKDHAYRACLSALESQLELSKLNVVFEQKGWPKISIGIGMNTGEMSVGNMGSQIVQNYTVMGDAVNLASRLEGATKEYGVKILISEFTKNDLTTTHADAIVLRYADILRVKGKSKPVEIYEVVARKENFTAWDSLKSYNDAMAQYKNKDFTAARNIFSKLATADSTDGLAALYVERCDEFLLEPPPSDWDGVFNLKTK